MTSLLRPALLLFAMLSVVTGLAYPALVTGAMQVLFPAQANGSLIRDGERVLGSRLIGQPFAAPGRFWGRPSATAPVPYNAAASTGTNQGPSNPALHDAVKARIEALRAADPGNTAPVPADLVTASGSGLDPHLSPAAALYQVGRVARARGMQEDAVRRLVEARTEPRTLGLLGEPRVNVLLLNFDLERATQGGS
jgi:K+-transporting ATPase ATPase C chain